MADDDTIYRYLLAKIEEACGVPMRLDSERSLAAKFGVPPSTARRVLRRLVQEGYAQAEEARGYFACASVAHHKQEHATVGIVYERDGSTGAIYPRAQERQITKLVAELRQIGINSILSPIAAGDAKAIAAQVARRGDIDAYLLCSLPTLLEATLAVSGKPAVVWGVAYEDLGLPSVGMNWAEIGYKIAAELFDRGHRCISLLHEHRFRMPHERIETGFKYAHLLRQVRFNRDRVVSVYRHHDGVQPAIRHLSLLAPTAVIVSCDRLLERLWDRADDAFRQRMHNTEVIVLSGMRAVARKYNADLVEGDFEFRDRKITELLVDLVQRRALVPRHYAIPWTLVRATELSTDRRQSGPAVRV